MVSVDIRNFDDLFSISVILAKILFVGLFSLLPVKKILLLFFTAEFKGVSRWQNVSKID